MQQIKMWWEKLTVTQKKKVVLLAIVISVVLIGVVGYIIRGTDSSQPQQVAQKKEITLEPTLLQKTQLQESARQMEELKKQIEELKLQRQKEQEELQKQIEQERKKAEEEIEKIKTQPAAPPPPPPSGQVTGPVAAPMASKVETAGSIAIVSQNIPQKREDEKDLKKKTTKIYLPPSFMEATLLSGLDAPAVGKGEGHPVPVLLRVKTPAVLPNQVKTNLKGCFIIAEGLGSLATERAELRLVSLSCIDRKGRAVIDAKVKGFVVDSDGKIGLRGRVVSKMGSALARAFVAGLVGGFGQALGQGAGQQAVSFVTTGTETKTQVDWNKVGWSALGSGIMQASNELQKFYLELARQSIPVVEILATRNVTLVISEGMELEVKEY